MDVDIDRSKPNVLRRLLVWAVGFLLTGRVSNGYTWTSLRQVSPVRVVVSLLQVGVVLGAIWYFFDVVPGEYVLYFAGITTFWVGLRGVMVVAVGGVAWVLERVQYYRRADA